MIILIFVSHLTDICADLTDKSFKLTDIVDILTDKSAKLTDKTLMYNSLPKKRRPL